MSADEQTAFGLAVWGTMAAQLEKLFDFSTTMSVMYVKTGNLVYIIAYYAFHRWVWRQLLWLSFGALRSVNRRESALYLADLYSGFVINFARPSKSNLSIGLMAHLVNIEVLFFLVTKIPAAVMMPYVVQVCGDSPWAPVHMLTSPAPRVRPVDPEERIVAGTSHPTGSEQ